MKKQILLSTILALSLSAGSINFHEAPEVTKRVMPGSSKNVLLSYNAAVKEAMNSIVHISTTVKAAQSNQIPQMFNHPFFEQFFGGKVPKQHNAPKRHGLGSGVIVSKDGYIITNNHVIDKADEIMVTIPGRSNKEYSAKLIGADPKSDVAVIKVDANDLDPIMIGNSEDLDVGDVVFAIGNPFGVGQSVTQGIISANNKDSVGINEYEDFIQTDASINPGNSGGALVDSRGALIGINTAIITRSGGNNGIGFAIEVDMAKTIAKRLIEKGSIERGYLGVSIGNLENNVKDLYKNREGAVILEVQPNSPAAKAGLKRGDLIINVNEKKITSASTLKNYIGLQSPGESVKVTYERDKRTKSVTLKLENMNAATEGDTEFEGLTLVPLNDNVRYQYQIPHSINGVLVSDVKEGTEAQKQGIQAGDIIVQVESYPVKNIETLNNALKMHKGKYKRVYINRGGRVFMVALK